MLRANSEAVDIKIIDFDLAHFVDGRDEEINQCHRST
jgi:hypothetical protein